MAGNIPEVKVTAENEDTHILEEPSGTMQSNDESQGYRSSSMDDTPDSVIAPSYTHYGRYNDLSTASDDDVRMSVRPSPHKGRPGSSRGRQATEQDEIPDRPGTSHGGRNDEIPDRPGTSHGGRNDEIPERPGTSHGGRNDEIPERPGTSHGGRNDEIPEQTETRHGDRDDGIPERPGSSHGNNANGHSTSLKDDHDDDYINNDELSHEVQSIRFDDDSNYYNDDEDEVINEVQSVNMRSDDPYDDYVITDDQQAAMLELQHLQDEEDYPINDEPLEYDVTERLKQLNAELAEQPDPKEEERERTITFKEGLVAGFAAPPDYSGGEDEEDDAIHNSDTEEGQGDGFQQTGKQENQENPNGEEEQTEEHSDADDLEVQKLTLNESHTEQSEQQSKNSGKSSDQKGNKVLIERDGKFELIDADDVRAQELGLSPADPYTEPQPPNKPRPSTANHSQSRQKRTMQKKRSQSAGTSRQNEMDDFNYNSPYAISPDQKKTLQQQQKLSSERNRAAEERKREEEQEKRKENEEAFQAWLKQKQEENKQKRRQGKSEKKENESENCFEEWCKVKKEQRRKEKQLELEKQREIQDGFYIRNREDCEKSFKMWLRKKNKESRENQKKISSTSRLAKLSARRSRKSLALARALQQAQAFRYTDYYGYR